jgi:hypothetical protein
MPPPRFRIGASLRWATGWLLFATVALAGMWVFYKYGLIAFGGREKLWMFEKMEAHRYTAMAMLTGTLKLRAGLSKIGHDEQVFNGAAYTNWGFGVPLLELPFHALAGKMKSLPQRFFPDRAIYFSYFMGVTLVLWGGFNRLLALRAGSTGSKLTRLFTSWAATTFVVTLTLFPLMSCRFIVYEETICYFELAQFVALTGYIFSLQEQNPGAIVAIAVGAGFGLLIRPTGLPYFVLWIALVLLEPRRLRSASIFLAAASPLLGFWLYSNWVRSGALVATGLNNAMPWFDYHTHMQRFGSFCDDTREHTKQVARSLFDAFFSVVKLDPKETPWLDKCHLMYEERPPPVGESYAHEPFFGVSVLVALLWMSLDFLRRRERRLSAYLPVGLLLAMFGAYVWAGAGFTWRYVGDFWPAVVIAGAIYVRFLPRTAQKLLGLPLGLAFFACAWATFDRSIEPHVTTLEILDEGVENVMWADFSNSRYAQDRPLPSKVHCGDRADWIYHNGLGWRDGCRVDTFTNVFVGVPEKSDTHYTLTIKTEDVPLPSLPVYFNGRIYTAIRTGDRFVADVDLHYDRLSSPIAMTTIQWTKTPDPMPFYRLLSVELS